MTQQQLHNQLLKTVRAAKNAGMCPACVVMELAAAAQAVIEVASLTTEELKLHRVDPVLFSTVARSSCVH